MGENVIYTGKNCETNKWMLREIEGKAWSGGTVVVLCSSKDIDGYIGDNIGTCYYESIHVLTSTPLFSELIKESKLTRESIAELLCVNYRKKYATNMEYILMRLICEMTDTNRFFDSLEEMCQLTFSDFILKAEKADKELTDMMLTNTAEAQKYYDGDFKFRILTEIYSNRPREIHGLKRETDCIWFIPVDPTACTSSLLLECLYRMPGRAPLFIFINCSVTLAEWRSLYTSKLQGVSTYMRLPGLNFLKTAYPDRYKLLASMTDRAEFVGEQMVGSTGRGSSYEEILSIITGGKDDMHDLIHNIDNMQDNYQISINDFGYFISKPTAPAEKIQKEDTANILAIPQFSH